MTPDATAGDYYTSKRLTLERPLQVLTPHLIALIDKGLADLGSFGEVRLVVRDGKLRFLETVQSIDLNK